MTTGFSSPSARAEGAPSARTRKKERVAGLDLARTAAFLGILLVNFTVPHFMEHGGGLLLTGNAAALFVVIAGVGISWLSSGARNEPDPALRRARLGKARAVLLRRALFLAVVGLALLAIGWDGDIIHYYAVWIALAAFLLSASNAGLAAVAGAVIVVFHLSLPWYERGWDWETLEYSGFWTLGGFLRNLFFNGFHPVFPWFAFIVIGMWVGRLDLRARRVRLGLGLGALAVFVLFEALSWGALALARGLGADTGPESDWRYALGTDPTAPTLFFTATGAAAAVACIAVCLEIGERWGGRGALAPLIGWGATTGRHLLTHYIVHSLLMLALFIALEAGASPSLDFLFGAAAANFIGAGVFSVLWNRRHPLGPVETVMRRLCG